MVIGWPASTLERLEAMIPVDDPGASHASNPSLKDEVQKNADSGR